MAIPATAQTSSADAPLGATKTLVGFAASLRYEHMTEAERKATRRHVLDTLGACLAGVTQDVPQLAAGLLDDLIRPGRIPVPGLKRRYDVLSAAYISGTSGHGLEVDDGYRAGSVHPGTVVVPAVLAASHGTACSGRDLMRAVAIGYEASGRLAAAIHPRSRRRGYHNTPVVGVLAAALAVGALRGLDEQRLEQALGIAASSAAGLFGFLHGGGEVKRLHAGFAAREGLLAALLAERGMTGPVDVLEGRDGFFQAFAGDDVRLTLAGAPGDPQRAPLAISQCYIKPHSCCRHFHAAIDALLDMRKAEHLAPDAVARVEVGTYAIAAEHAHTGWQDMASAQMSFPFTMAVALAHGQVDVPSYLPDARRDPTVLAHCGKVSIAVDEECERIYPGVRAARVAVTTTSGQRHERMVREPFGSPTHPLSDEMLAEKFRKLAEPTLGVRRARALERMVMTLDELPEAARLIERSAL